jgi:hypothetical protein
MMANSLTLALSKRERGLDNDPLALWERGRGEGAAFCADSPNGAQYPKCLHLSLDDL